MAQFPKTLGPAATIYSMTGNNPGQGLPQSEGDDRIVINFPNLPDEIPLDRDTEWRVYSNQMMPDGFHVYQHTAPLTIPLTFKLSAFDDYAVNGPETILEIAARLHALTLPVITGKTALTRGSSSATTPGGPSLPKEAKNEAAGDSDTSGVGAIGVAGGQAFYFPPACVLDLMIGSGGASGLGIRCIGYVKSVGVILKGPWLNSGSTSVNRNLPSFGEFRLTFVHVPGYSNSVDFLNALQVIPQVGAKLMKNQLYNTVDMLTTADQSDPNRNPNQLGNSSLLGYKGL